MAKLHPSLAVCAAVAVSLDGRWVQPSVRAHGACAAAAARRAGAATARRRDGRRRAAAVLALSWMRPRAARRRPAGRRRASRRPKPNRRSRPSHLQRPWPEVPAAGRAAEAGSHAADDAAGTRGGARAGDSRQSSTRPLKNLNGIDYKEAQHRSCSSSTIKRRASHASGRSDSRQEPRVRATACARTRRRCAAQLAGR